MIRPVSIAAVAAASAVLLALPSAAQAHDPDHVYLLTSGGDEAPDSFGTAAKTDAALTALPTALPDYLISTGIEIVDEQGYGVGVRGVDPPSPAVFLWDHTTGAVSPAVILGVTPAALGALVRESFDSTRIQSVWGLDAMSDGTLLTIAVVTGYAEGQEFPPSYAVVASLDPSTGTLIPLVVLDADPYIGEWPGDFETRWYSDLATDPTTGITYVFGEIDDEGTRPSVATVDLGGGTVDGPVDLAGEIDLYEGSGGTVFGADFEDDGRLWLSVDVFQLESTRLIDYAPGFAVGATPTDVGELPRFDDPPRFIESSNLAVESAPAPPTPGLPATGAAVPAGLLVLALGAVAAGAGVLAVRRRGRAT